MFIHEKTHNFFLFYESRMDPMSSHQLIGISLKFYAYRKRQKENEFEHAWQFANINRYIKLTR